MLNEIGIFCPCLCHTPESITSLGTRLSQLFAPLNYNEIVLYLRRGDFTITYDTLRRYLTDERRPDFEFLIKVADLKNVSLDWILTGQSEQYWRANSHEELWAHYQTNEIRALRIFSARMGLSLIQAVHRLTIDGLFAFDLITNPHPLKFYQKQAGEKEVPIQIWGEIKDGELFVEAMPRQRVSIPAEIEPKKISTDSELRGKPLYHLMFHAYRVGTGEYEKLGIPAGCLIVCGHRNSFGYRASDEDEPILLQAGAGTKLLLRRYYFDYQRGAGYVYQSLIDRRRIERFTDVNATHMETIHAVVI